jgi:hypothetical protein
MNHTEHTMPRAGRTVDRETVAPGWAGFHYRGPSVWERVCGVAQQLGVYALFALIGAMLAWRG